MSHSLFTIILSLNCNDCNGSGIIGPEKLPCNECEGLGVELTDDGQQLLGFLDVFRPSHNHKHSKRKEKQWTSKPS